jgi:hypothetical protein
MYALIIILLVHLPLCAFADAVQAGEQPGRAEFAPPQWATPGSQWHVTVKQYSRAWGKGYSNPKTAERAQIPRVEHEFDMTIRLLGVEKSDNRKLARLEFIPGNDAPENSIRSSRYTLTIDMHTLRVVEAECTEGQRVKTGKLTPWTIRTEADVHNVLFARVYAFPVDWVIEGDDMDRAGVDCFVARRPPEVGGKGHWERIRPADLDEETPYTYRTEFRRTVTRIEDGQGIKVVVFSRGSFEDTPTYEIEQVWDPQLGWWRSFKRTRQGHIDLEATLVTE